MPLPVLPNTFAQSSADLIRLFHQSQLEWSRHLGEETQLDFGRWISNSEFPDSTDANCLHDAFLLPGLSALQLIETMERKAEQAKSPWRRCSLSPSMPTGDLVETMVKTGWESDALKIFHRRKVVDLAPTANPALTIIPTRASYRHYRQLLQRAETQTREDKKGVEYLFHQMPYLQGDKRYSTPYLSSPYLSSTFASVETQLLHLDDPHLDSLLALVGGKPIGCIGVLTSGEFGTLRNWYVVDEHLTDGTDRVLLDRALEICTRGLLKHVMIGLPPDATKAIHLVREAGFDDIGEWVNFIR